MDNSKMNIPTTVKNKALVNKRRDQLVQAAIKLFSSKGFFKTTLRDLAAETGLSSGSIYDYVGNKEDLIYLIHDLLAGTAMKEFESTIPQIEDPIEKLRRMISLEFRVMHQASDALLLMYRESHALKKKHLKQILKKERNHLSKFEEVLQECVQKGYLQERNVRVLSNVLKGMAEAYDLKRWDLRGYASPDEFENIILELIFKGLPISEANSGKAENEKLLSGKCVLLANISTILGKALCSFLTSQGAKVAVCTREIKTDREFPEITEESQKNITLFSLDKNMEISSDLFNEIARTLGTIDIYIQDLGVGNTELPKTKDKKLLTDFLQRNFQSAQKMSTDAFQAELIQKKVQRIVYLAPWAWDQYIDPMTYKRVIR